jgi:hypothetical protein
VVHLPGYCTVNAANGDRRTCQTNDWQESRRTAFSTPRRQAGSPANSVGCGVGTRVVGRNVGFAETGAAVVGAAVVGAAVVGGRVVGLTVVGAAVFTVGADVGNLVGDAVTGLSVVGAVVFNVGAGVGVLVGDAVTGLTVVTATVGLAVGLAVVGALVGFALVALSVGFGVLTALVGVGCNVATGFGVESGTAPAVRTQGASTVSHLLFNACTPDAQQLLDPPGNSLHAQASIKQTLSGRAILRRDAAPLG